MLVSEEALAGSEEALAELLVCEGALVGFIIPLLDVTELDLSSTCVMNESTKVQTLSVF